MTKQRSAEEVWLLLQQVVDAHSRHGELAAALGFRLGAGRGRVLYQLRERPLTLTELATANGFDAPYTTLVVDKLQSHGLVERTPHPDDGRRKLVTLTAAGRDALATADAIRRRAPAALGALTGVELRELRALLGRVVAADRPESPAGEG